MFSTGDFIDDYATDPIAKNTQSSLFLVTLDSKGIKERSEELGTLIAANGIWHRFQE